MSPGQAGGRGRGGGGRGSGRPGGRSGGRPGGEGSGGRDRRGGRDGGRDAGRGGPRGEGRGDDRRAYSRQRPSERARRTDPARLAAYTVMRRVADGAYANLELPKLLREKGVRGRDAGFATELVYGALRLRGRYDPIIERAAQRPVGQIDGAVLDTLRLGAHQLLGMRVPAHAAADETVALARQVNGAGAAGFVNAVMRRISERPLEEWLTEVAPGDGLADLAVRESHPEWVVKAMRQALLGHGAADPATVDRSLADLLAADNAPPRVTLVARPGLATRDELEEASATPGPLAPTAALLEAGDPGAIAAVREGRAAVQDEGSQLIALALASAGIEGDAAERWLDLCAGPGGKAGLLAALAAQQGAHLLANEVSEHRTDLVRQSLRAAIAAAPGRIEVRTGDGRDIGEAEPAAYDRVLVDAPCTGLGALRRRPEARWRRTTADLAELGPLQRALLNSAIEATRPGGLIAYATCSPHLAETSLVVSDVLKRRDDVEQVDARPLFEAASEGRLGDLGPGPAVQLWPHLHGTDGMYCAILRRR
ncbi:MAG: rRNA small subunit methyltransferase B [Micrococcales bacterium]|nr:rRNA small subunit methyltransferase B [Micrococcales bacterium]